MVYINVEFEGVWNLEILFLNSCVYNRFFLHIDMCISKATAGITIISVLTLNAPVGNCTNKTYKLCTTNHHFHW